jgi:hypothetical protein
MTVQVLTLPSYGAVALGVVLGAFGLVREGALLIALGTAGVAVSRRSDRAIERYLPLTLALALLVLAIAIPGGR